MISQKEGRVARELAAAEDSPYLAGKSPRRPLLPLPASASDPASCGFSEDAMRGHPFFKECGAAVEAENADTVVPAVEGTVQDMSDDETAPAAAYWAFASIEDNVHAFLNYISSEVRFGSSFQGLSCGSLSCGRTETRNMKMHYCKLPPPKNATPHFTRCCYHSLHQVVVAHHKCS